MKKSLRIAILGTRGIPNAYGGFEQCAHYLAPALVERDHEVYVYCSSRHPQKTAVWRGVRLHHIPDPEPWMGAAGQFIYDLNSLLHARRQGFDVLLHMGYTSSSVWWWLWPKRARNIVNMDGMEHQRGKYGTVVKAFLRTAERWAATHADMLIADNAGIGAYLEARYPHKNICQIAYGVDFTPVGDVQSVLEKFGLEKGRYDLAICRMEPENHAGLFVEVYSGQNHPLVMVGGMETKLGKCLAATATSNVHLLGKIFDKPTLDALRAGCRHYLHGHSVGGTNPSLLEAMAHCRSIVAHDNPFNRAVLGTGGRYFKTGEDLCHVLSEPPFDGLVQNIASLQKEYAWETIVTAYENVCLGVAEV